VEPRRLEVTSWEVPLGGLRSEVSLLHLTDLHVGSLALRPEDLIRRLGPAALACRILCLTGDFCDRPQEVPGVEAFLAPLLHAMALQGGGAVRAFAVWGNHDRRAGTERLAEVLGRLGVTVLDNRAVAVDGLWIAGVRDPTRREDQLEEAVAAIPPGAPFVLLAHNPSVFPRAVAAGVPLTLAGHTHGGQVRVGGVRALAAPHRHRYDRGGWYRQGDRAMYVSRGLGTSFLPIRLGARPEVAVFHLVPHPSPS
jgi:predicted MPP superfamily phosphohydrolase